MKKLFLAAGLACTAFFSNAATDYVVFSGDPLKADEIQIPLNDRDLWYGNDVLYKFCDMAEDATSPDGQSMSFEILEGREWFGTQWFSAEGFELTPLHTEAMALVFYAKTNEGNETDWRLHITAGGAGIEQSFEVPADGEWHKIVFNLSEYEAYYNALPDATNSVVFSIIGNSLHQGDMLYITDVRYTEDEFKAGGTWYGTFYKQDVNVVGNYAITANKSGTLGLKLELLGGEDLEDLNPSVHVFTPGMVDEWVSLTKGDNNIWTGVSTYKCTVGESLNVVEFYCPYAGGVFGESVTHYVFGSSNDEPSKEPTVLFSASANNVTVNSAEINFHATGIYCGDATPVVYMDGDVVNVEDNTIVLSDLTDNTEYTHTLYAEVEVDGVTYKSDEVVVTFTTIAKDAKAKEWHGVINFFASNAYYVGEKESKRRSLPVSLYVDLNYNPDKTITLTTRINTKKEIVGMEAPYIVVVQAPGMSGQPDHKQIGEQYAWQEASITTEGHYDEGALMQYFNMTVKWDGGSTSEMPLTYTVGEENEPIKVGELNNLELEIDHEFFTVGDEYILAPVGTDVHGNFIFNVSDVVSFKTNNTAFEVEKRADATYLLARQKGEDEVTVYVTNKPEITVTLPVVCALSSSSVRLEGTTWGDHENHAYAYDNNEDNMVIWNEGEEHHIVVDLGVGRPIESVEVVWEGASAKEYTVTLSWFPIIENPDEPAPAAAPARAAEEEGGEEAVENATHVFEVTDGEGGNTVHKTFYLPDYQHYGARYVTLQTKTAYNPVWGIKLKNMNINGKEEIAVSAISDVTVDTTGEVEFYNLQGVRVQGELAPGLYIRRQGNTATKIVVR